MVTNCPLQWRDPPCQPDQSHWLAQVSLDVLLRNQEMASHDCKVVYSIMPSRMRHASRVWVHCTVCCLRRAVCSAQTVWSRGVSTSGVSTMQTCVHEQTRVCCGCVARCHLPGTAVVFDEGIQPAMPVWIGRQLISHASGITLVQHNG